MLEWQPQILGHITSPSTKYSREIISRTFAEKSEKAKVVSLCFSKAYSCKLRVSGVLFSSEGRHSLWSISGRAEDPEHYRGSSNLAALCVSSSVAEWYRYRTVACLVTSSSPVPLKTHRVGQRCTLNLLRAETSSRWCGVVVKRKGWPAQVSSTSLDHCSKLRGPSPKTLV
ncbi:uncharacterized protein TNCV_4707061 [Trichonephila clavipes]|nr:uncharacterized protein TNCV_4707061 [Trichonephila clavipes]